MSLEMLLKLVAVFGPVIRSTVSASPAVGVDLQAEQRFLIFRLKWAFCFYFLWWVWVIENYLVR